jgi:hypothetical protein
MKRTMQFLALLLLVACSDDPVQPVDETDLKFMRFESSSAITVRQASFWAVKGRDSRLLMRYAPTQPGDEGHKFLEFKVDDNSLLRRPNGSLFLPGDSVLITVRLDDSDRFIVHFEPSGLVFNPLEPAELEISYERGDRDIDDDGDRDDSDVRLEQQLRVWRQERPGLPWLPLVSVRIDDDEIEGRVLSFTGFAMASN